MKYAVKAVLFFVYLMSTMVVCVVVSEQFRPFPFECGYGFVGFAVWFIFFLILIPISVDKWTGGALP